jgi:hypothetical protein
MRFLITLVFFVGSGLLSLLVQHSHIRLDEAKQTLIHRWTLRLLEAHYWVVLGQHSHLRTDYNHNHQNYRVVLGQHSHIRTDSIQFNISLLPFLIQVKRWNFPLEETLYKLNSITIQFRWL